MDDNWDDVECKGCECPISHCCCADGCPVCGHAPTHCDGLAGFAKEFGMEPLPQAYGAPHPAVKPLDCWEVRRKNG